MSTADIVILSVILLPTIVGVLYGFLNIIFSLLSWVISLGLAVKLIPYFSPLLSDYIDSPMLRIVLVFIILFILCLLIMSGICYFIVKLLSRTGLTAMDRFLGLFFWHGPRRTHCNGGYICCRVHSLPRGNLVERINIDKTIRAC